MMVGEIPDGLSIDHIDGDGSNNRMDNLRVVTPSQNMKNIKIRSDSKSGHHGIYWSERLGGWIAQAWSDGAYLGSRTFADKDSAIAWRSKIQMENGFHANHGRTPG